MKKNRPRYKQAAWSLIDSLKSVGVSCVAGYSEPRDGKLYCYVQHQRELDLVPSEWKGFPVVAEVETVRPGDQT